MEELQNVLNKLKAIKNGATEILLEGGEIIVLGIDRMQESIIEFCKYDGFSLKGEFHENYDELTMNELLYAFKSIDYNNLDYDKYLNEDGTYKERASTIIGTFTK